MPRRLGMFVVLILAVGLAVAEPSGLGPIRARGELRVCADPANLPFSSAEAATPGFEVELARLVARELGVEARVQWHPTVVRALQPLREGECDLFMGLPTDERFAAGTPWVAVSRPYYVMSHALVARADSSIRTLGDLAAQRVAIEAASVADLYLLDKDVQRGLYKNQVEAFRAVAAGEAPAALLWRPVASWLARSDAALRVIALADPRLEFPVGAGVQRRNRELADAIDAAIGRLQERGEVQQVLERYGVSAEPPAASSAGAATTVQANEATEKGRSVYATVCSRCHGAEGSGGGMFPTLRNYARGWDRFLQTVQNGRPGTPMAPFKNILKEEEIRSVYQYLTSLPPQ
jgi:polar amino acid transport system substrate-binding protein